MPITYANKNKNAAAGQPERTWRDGAAFESNRNGLTLSLVMEM